MAGLITTIQDALNPHVRFAVSSSSRGKLDAGTIKRILKQQRVTTWGWEVTDERVVFRVYRPHRHTARGVLKERGMKLDD